MNSLSVARSTTSEPSSSSSEQEHLDCILKECHPSASHLPSQLIEGRPSNAFRIYPKQASNLSREMWDIELAQYDLKPPAHEDSPRNLMLMDRIYRSLWNDFHVSFRPTLRDRTVQVVQWRQTETGSRSSPTNGADNTTPDGVEILYRGHNGKVLDLSSQAKIGCTSRKLLAVQFNAGLACAEHQHWDTYGYQKFSKEEIDAFSDYSVDSQVTAVSTTPTLSLEDDSLSLNITTKAHQQNIRTQLDITETVNSPHDDPSCSGSPPFKLRKTAHEQNVVHSNRKPTTDNDCLSWMDRVSCWLAQFQDSDIYDSKQSDNTTTGQLVPAAKRILTPVDILEIVNETPTCATNAALKERLLMLPAFFQIAPDVMWSKKLSWLIKKYAALVEQGYWLASIGGGWASMKNTGKALEYAQKQYAVGSMLQDNFIQHKCKVYKAYNRMWVGKLDESKAILEQELKEAEALKDPVLVNVVTAASLHLERHYKKRGLVLESSLPLLRSE
eukprot:TRINITY_DN75221_c0_g1_i1.p1 TRINITY_DN75221_c0_g1~~TRINITY_DN75221_c0_g1_i1.p1  ORF type:complete len:499 (-),score=48.72 TRINITY_DN75221_c0_g1_i1:52-1548(-)